MVPEKAHLTHLIAHLQHGLVERDTATKLCLLALLSGEHILLIGPPGTAKSEPAKRLHALLPKELHYFERLLTRFTLPEELFGPFSLKALEEDRYLRQTSGYLPHASIAFLDEIFKANSAILNSLLTLINERQFDNGTQREAVPLWSLIGASNELPAEQELQALYDRFLIRYHVLPTSEEGFAQLIAMEDTDAPPLEQLLTQDARDAINAKLQQITLSPELITLIKALRAKLVELQIEVSDRRWRKILKILKTAALTSGHDTVSLFHGWLLQHMLWSEPEQREQLHELFVSHIGQVTSVGVAQHIERMLFSLSQLCAQDEAQHVQKRDPTTNEPIYRAKDGSETTEAESYHMEDDEGELLYLAPHGDKDAQKSREARDAYTAQKLMQEFGRTFPGNIVHNGRNLRKDAYLQDQKNWVMATSAPLMVPMRFSKAHIDGRCERVTNLQEELEKCQAHLQAQRGELATLIEQDLWIPDDFLKVATKKLDEQLEITSGWITQALDLRYRFSALLVELEQGGEQ